MTASTRPGTTPAALIASVTAFVEAYMSSYDASHDMNHIRRVVALAHHILAEEEKSSTDPSTSLGGPGTISGPGLGYDGNETHKPQYDHLTITLAALLHDVNDRKYMNPNIPPTSVENVLLDRGATKQLAEAVQVIVEHVSYSKEMKLLALEREADAAVMTFGPNVNINTNLPTDHVHHPESESTPTSTLGSTSTSASTSESAGFTTSHALRAIMSTHPELRIVQDADRLDAIGAVGIGRTFTYGGAHPGPSPTPSQPASTSTQQHQSINKSRSMDETMLHFTEKLERLEYMMKTRTGRAMARERTRRLRLFREWWAEEVSFEGSI